VDAAGNVRNIGGNTNESVMTNNRDVIVVGEINTVADLGGLESSRISSSTPGASLLVSAPGSNIISTSVSVENENGTVMGTDYDKGSGTSFSAAIVSGVVALMLEANPNLGYRDVQEILALTARKVNDPSTDWKDNGAKNSNGGGMHVSHDYGFGEVDALARCVLPKHGLRSGLRPIGQRLQRRRRAAPSILRFPITMQPASAVRLR
jgi:hypothetical protein